MAHTPGPWTQHKDAPLYIMAKVGCIASVNHVEKGRGVIVEDETKANARLIAAAPDLLAALRACAEFWRNGTPIHFGSDVATDALDAIAKATQA